MSSNEATPICNGAPRTISAARIAAASVGSATATRDPSAAAACGNMLDSRRNRCENLGKRSSRHQLGERYPRQFEETGNLVSQVVRRDFNGLPQFLQRLAASPGFSETESGSGTSGEARAKQISVEILKRIAGADLMLPAAEMIFAAVQKNFTHLSRRLHMFFQTLSSPDRHHAYAWGRAGENMRL